MVRALNKPRRRYQKLSRNETLAKYGSLHVAREQVGECNQTPLAMFRGGSVWVGGEWQWARLWGPHRLPYPAPETAKEGGLAALLQTVIKEVFLKDCHTLPASGVNNTALKKDTRTHGQGTRWQGRKEM